MPHPLNSEQSELRWRLAEYVREIVADSYQRAKQGRDPATFDIEDADNILAIVNSEQPTRDELEALNDAVSNYEDQAGGDIPDDYSARLAAALRSLYVKLKGTT